MSSNISEPLPNKPDNPGKKVRKNSGDLDDTKKALVFTTDLRFPKKGILTWLTKRKTKLNVAKEAITPPYFSKKEERHIQQNR